ncbi:MAG TPA: lipoyl(octanoyl) transferase LipB [Myxococcota bacterium]|nr:lipoyl(octanoyl) transferase LipB [Myxococcota bacterium]
METISVTESLEVRRLGRVPYGDALALQESLREALRCGEARETVLLLEHPDVVTFGRGARPENALASDAVLQENGYEVFRVSRGGDVTWHGPGQLVGYPILDLRRHGSDLHRYLRDLESVLTGALAEFGIVGHVRPGFAGVWLDARRKIASIGVGVRDWRTLHGFALNVDCDLGRFGAIVPCGLAGVEMVSMASVLGRAVDFTAVTEAVERGLRKVFA